MNAQARGNVDEGSLPGAGVGLALEVLDQHPWLKWAVLALVAALTLRFVMSVRMARATQRDPVRLFDPESKGQVAAWCGGQCEHKSLLWRRCSRPGTQGDHLIPWSRGGPTTIENLAMLCGPHNRRKSNHMPSMLYRWRLAYRRRAYFPPGVPRLPKH